MTGLVEHAKQYGERPVMDLSSERSDAEAAATRYLLYILLPLWTSVGLLDWYWHKSTDIEHTAGVKESLIHFLMFAEVGAPTIMALLLDVNAGMLAAMAAGVLTHSVTAYADVKYASENRLIKPGEQHTHSLQEVLPLMALTMTGCVHYDQVRSTFGKGPKKADWGIRLKRERLPFSYLAGIAGMIAGCIAVPYANELWRCWRARKEPKYNGACAPCAEA